MADDARAAADLIEFLAKGIVNEPDAIKVTPFDGGELFELETADADRGRVIGRQGRVAKAMRAVLGASRTGRDSRLEIVD